MPGVNGMDEVIINFQPVAAYPLAVTRIPIAFCLQRRPPGFQYPLQHYDEVVALVPGCGDALQRSLAGIVSLI